MQPDNITGMVAFSLGGVPRRAKVSLALAPVIEEATGRGLVRLMRDAASGDLRISDAAEILRATVAAAGVSYDRSETIDLMEHEGAVASLASAGLIIGQLFRVPASAKKGKAKGAAAPETEAATASP